MQSSVPTFDIPFFKGYMDEAPTKENGWKLDHDGPVSKEFKDSPLKIYKKLIEGEPIVTIRVEASLKGVRLENLFTMATDIKYREKMERAPKVIKTVEQFNKNTDVIYTEMEFPFPLSNREFLQKRLYFGNKEDKELVKRLGMYEKDHRYYAVLVQSTERDDYPKKNEPIRAETKIQFILIEEVPNDPHTVKYTMVMCQRMNGDIPNMMINKMSSKMPIKIVEGFLDLYPKCFN